MMQIKNAHGFYKSFQMIRQMSPSNTHIQRKRRMRRELIYTKFNYLLALAKWRSRSADAGVGQTPMSLTEARKKAIEILRNGADDVLILRDGFRKFTVSTEGGDGKKWFQVMYKFWLDDGTYAERYPKLFQSAQPTNPADCATAPEPASIETLAGAPSATPPHAANAQSFIEEHQNKPGVIVVFGCDYISALRESDFSEIDTIHCDFAGAIAWMFLRGSITLSPDQPTMKKPA